MLAKKKLRRNDFLFQNGWLQDKIKSPGELQMQQFQISNCEQCNIFLFDTAACVYIDDCRYCNIFIGACQSSVFVRNSRFLNVVCTTKQFRVRDCVDCNFSIFCESQPVMDSSYSINISCFPEFSYDDLEEQMKNAKMNPWNNNWYDVYDFTPIKFKRTNFQLKEMEEEQWLGMLRKLREKLREIGLKECRSIIPRVSGRKKISVNHLCVLVVYPIVSSTFHKGALILQSRVHSLTTEQQIGLHLNLPSKQPRATVLFLKIEKRFLSKFRSILPSINKEIDEIEQLQLYQNTVFAPFKDEH